MNIETFLHTVCQEPTQFVSLKDGKYHSILKPEEIDRDNFFRLRSQLIRLGCNKNEVINIAKRICMEILQVQSEQDYHRFVYEDTFKKCTTNIQFGYDPRPIQFIQDSCYSHINLFSSIYGFEIEYLRAMGFHSQIADIGCGEGLFQELAKLYGIDVKGFDIKMPGFHVKSEIDIIEDFYNINRSFKCLIYNHVLEHIQLRPDYYLRMVINHFVENFENANPEVIIISLPMHLDISSHLASNHIWVCSDDPIGNKMHNTLAMNGLKYLNPFEAFSLVAKKYNYRLKVNKQLGIYVFEKFN